MIRLIVTTSNWGAAVNVGGVVHTESRTFDIDHPELEKELRSGSNTCTQLSYELREKCEVHQ